MIGPVAIVIGLLGLWALVRGKAGPVLDAISSQSGFAASLDNALGNLNLNTTGASGNGSSGGGSHSVSGGNSNGGVDIGSHSGLVNGVVVTIDKSYGQMTDAEKDAANAFAHQIGNVSG